MILPRTNRSLSDRPAVDLSAVSERDHKAHAAETVLDQDAPSHLFVLAEKICLTLFDRWCEQRNVVALAYLMYAWPVLGNSPVVVRRLLQSLRELKKYHHEAPQGNELALLNSLLDNE
jgi:hypothetical protein